MKLAAITFTYAPDGECAVQCARALATLDVPHYLIEDAARPLSAPHRARAEAQGARVMASEHDRAGNLNGRENLAAQLAAMESAAAATGAEWVMKVDSDTAVMRLDWLAAADPDRHAAACLAQRKWWFQGPCYALNARAIPGMLALLHVRPEVLDGLEPKVPEDVATGWLAVELAGPEGVHAAYGYPDGPAVAHYLFKGAAELGELMPYAVVSFGNRVLLPPQMPDTLRRYTAGREMGAFLNGHGYPPEPAPAR